MLTHVILSPCKLNHSQFLLAPQIKGKRVYSKEMVSQQREIYLVVPATLMFLKCQRKESVKCFLLVVAFPCSTDEAYVGRNLSWMELMLHLIEYIGVLFNLDVVSEVKFSHVPLLSILAQWSTRSIAGGSSHTNILLMGYDFCQNSPGAGRLSVYNLEVRSIFPFAWLYVSRILLISAAFGIAGCKYLFCRGRGES